VIDLQHKPRPSTLTLVDPYLLEQLVPPTHILRQIDAYVDFSFVRPLVAARYHAELGRPSLDPELLLRLIFLQRYYGLSDAEVVERAECDLSFRYFLHLDCNGELPDPSSLSRFRGRLGPELFERVFVGFLRQAQEQGLVESRRVWIDSASIQADMAVPGFRRLLRRLLSQALDSLEGVSAEVEWLRSELSTLAADRSYELAGPLRRRNLEEWLALTAVVHGVLEESGERRTGAQEALFELLGEALQRAVNHGKRNVKKDDLLSDVDPDARWARKKRGRQVVAGYSQQMAVDAAHGVVTDVQTTAGNVDDSQMLRPLVEGHTANVGAKPGEVVSDSKYSSGSNHAHLLTEGIGDHVAVPPAKGSKQGKFSPADFALEFDESGKPTAAMCPAGQLAQVPRWKRETHSWVFQFRKGQCEGCPLRERCSKQKRGRQLSVDQHYEVTEQARSRQHSEEGQAAQVDRLNVERTFAATNRRGGRRTPYRGLAKNRLFGYLQGMVLNVVTMARSAAKAASGYVTDGGRKCEEQNLDRLAMAPGVHCA